MKLICKKQQIELINCIKFKQRLIGFMFKKNADYGLIFPNCNSIHTFFMKMNIDVLMLNKNNEILYVYNNLKPNKIILPKKNVSKVIELPHNTVNIEINDKIKIK